MPTVKHTITRVRVNSLEKLDDDPDEERDEVDLGEKTEEQGTSQGAHSEDHDLRRMGIFRCQAEGCRILVMNFMYILVKDRSVQCSVC